MMKNFSTCADFSESLPATYIFFFHFPMFYTKFQYFLPDVIFLFTSLPYTLDVFEVS